MDERFGHGDINKTAWIFYKPHTDWEPHHDRPAGDSESNIAGVGGCWIWGGVGLWGRGAAEA